MTKLSKARIRKKLYPKFWRGFEDYLADKATRVKVTADRCGGGQRHWMRPCNVGRSGFNLVAAHWVMEKEVRATLRIGEGEKAGRCYEFFDLLEAQKEEIEQEMVRELTWERMPKERKPPKKRGEGPIPKIYLSQEADLYDKEAWSEQYVWLLAGLKYLHRVFEDRIRNLTT